MELPVTLPWPCGKRGWRSRPRRLCWR